MAWGVGTGASSHAGAARARDTAPVADLEDAVRTVTDPANVSPMGVTGPKRLFAVNQSRVMRELRNSGAGKAEARELALEAVRKVGGGAESRVSRGGHQADVRGERAVESWWIPAEAVRF
jgi:hypothetical protein